MFATVDFTSVNQLAEYKVALDVFSVVLFFTIVIWAFVGKHAYFALVAPLVPSVLTISLSGYLAFMVIPTVDSFLTLAGHSLITAALFGIMQLMLILVLQGRVYCFAYTVKLMMPAWQKCRRLVGSA